MAYTDTHRTSQERERREAALAAMRAKFTREQRPVTKQAKRWRAQHAGKTGNIPPQGRRSDITLGQLAHACRIAAKMASEQPRPNPLFTEALEMAAEYFDEAATAFPTKKY